MPRQLKYNATLTERIDLEPTLAIFRIKPDKILRRGAPTDPWFEPGQYLTIGMNRDGVASENDPRPLSVRRAMSIASAPEDEDAVELYIRFVTHPESDLPLTHVMWPIKAGDRLYCRALATGRFTLRDTVGDDARLKLMVAAGTGVAPFVCIARSRVRRDPDARLDDLAILHGASYPSGLGFRDELERLVRDHGLKYIPTISRPHEVDGWDGVTGRVESLTGPEHFARTERALGLEPGGLNPDNASVLICGLQGTIANTILNLIPRGYVPDHRKIRRALDVEDDARATIFWEQYDATPVIDLKDDELMAKLRRQLHAAL
jgi:ferredoxin/flavodoxin---NADP+ reductase